MPVRMPGVCALINWDSIFARSWRNPFKPKELALPLHPTTFYNVLHGPVGPQVIESVGFYRALCWRSFAFLVRASAAAFDAFTAIFVRSSGLSFAARALPPMLPKALMASDVSLIFLLLVRYCFGPFGLINSEYTMR